MSIFIRLFLLLGLFFISCQSSSISISDQHARFNMGDDPSSLDPRLGNDILTNNITSFIYEGLTRLNEDGTPLLTGAKAVSISKDQRTYTFILRKNYWSDGTAVTAYHYRDTLLSSLSPSFPSTHVYQLYPILNARKAKLRQTPLDKVGIDAIDDQTLEIQLEYPSPYFLELVSGHMYFPVKDSTTHPYPGIVSNGPFSVNHWMPQRELAMKPNTYYWDNANVKLKKLTFFTVENDIIELNMFENGELDWAGSPLTHLPFDAIEELSKKEHIFQVPVAGIYWFKFNTKSPPFTNTNLRKAFALSLNRDKLITHIIQTKQVAATSPVPDLIKKNKTPLFTDGDLKKARILFNKALKELKLKKEELPPLILSYNSGNDHQKLAQAIQQQWYKAFGVKVSLENAEWKVHLGNISQMNYQIGRLSWLADFQDPIAFLEQFKYSNSNEEGGNNDTNWEDPKFIELLDKASHTLDQSKRWELLQEAEQLFIDAMPVIPLYYITMSYLKKAHFKGAYITPLGKLELRHAFIEE